MATFNLFEEAILVRRVVRQGGITAKSGKQSRDVADRLEADRESFSTVVLKMTSKARAKIVQAINESQAIMDQNTLGWDTRAWNMCPAVRLAHVQREMDRIKNNFDDAVSEMLGNYDELRKDYLKRVTAKVAQEVPFPTYEQMQSNFSFDFLKMPLTNPNDFRLKHMSAEAVSELRTEMNEQINIRLADTQIEIVTRLIERVKKLHEQTADKDSRLFKSLVTNIEEDCDVLPKLNLTNDPEINRLIARVRAELSSIDVDTLKKDVKERALTHKLAGSVLDDLRSYNKNLKNAAPAPLAVTAPVKVVPTAEPVIVAPVKVKGVEFDFGSYAAKK